MLNLTDKLIINNVVYDYEYEAYTSIEEAIKAVGKDKALDIINKAMKQYAKNETYIDVMQRKAKD